MQKRDVEGTQGCLAVEWKREEGQRWGLGRGREAAGDR